MSCRVGCRHSLDLLLLLLWCRLVAIALIKPLAWEPPYAMGVTLIRQKEREKRKSVVLENLKKGKNKTREEQGR